MAAFAMMVAVYYAIPPGSGDWIGVLAFAAVALLSELAPVSVRTNFAEVTITLPIIWATMLLYGPFTAMAVAAIAFFTASFIGWTSAMISKHVSEERFSGKLRGVLSAIAGPWKDRIDYPIGWMFRSIFTNTGLEMISVGCAAVTYHLVGGVKVAGSISSASSADILFRIVLPFFAGVAANFLVDEAKLVTTWILGENRPEDTKDWYSFFLRWRILLRETVPLTWRQYLLLPLVTLLMVYLYVHVGFWSGLVVLGPFLSFRLSVQRAVEQQAVYMDTIATLGTYMQHYHPYTRGHLKRVSELSERLAKELRLSAEVIVLMPYAGLLHDIGKVGVSEEILDKVGKLTDEEWAAIKEHPVKGAEIVQHLEFLNKTVDWIKYHHKWANGSGYPDDGTKNGDVPVEAAIIAVADAFDAMTDDRESTVEWVCDSCGFKPDNGDRPVVCPICRATKRRMYREPLSYEQAIDELRRGVGSQFSPDVVKAFLKMVDREGLESVA